MLRTAFLLLLLVTATWLLGLLAVNSDTLSFHYLFAAFSCLQVGAGGVACDLCPQAAAVRRRGRKESLQNLHPDWRKPVFPTSPSPSQPCLRGFESVRTLSWLGQDRAWSLLHHCRVAQSPLVLSGRSTLYVSHQALSSKFMT